jgi:hypothetical protein
MLSAADAAARVRTRGAGVAAHAGLLLRAPGARAAPRLSAQPQAVAAAPLARRALRLPGSLHAAHAAPVAAARRYVAAAATAAQQSDAAAAPAARAAAAAPPATADASGKKHKLVTFYCLTRLEDPHAEVARHREFCLVRRARAHRRAGHTHRLQICPVSRPQLRPLSLILAVRLRRSGARHQGPHLRERAGRERAAVRRGRGRGGIRRVGDERPSLYGDARERV